MGERWMRRTLVLFAWLAAVDAGKKGSNEPVGVGAYAYQDTSGNRYGGTYDIDADDLQNLVYAPAFPAGFPGFPAHLSEFLRQLESSITPFGPQASTGGSSSYAGSSSYGGSSSHGGPGNVGGNFGHDYSAPARNYQHQHDGNSAYASGSVGPDGIRQVASINPGNPSNPNIDISSRSSGGNDGFYSVSSSSYASSSDNGGRKTSSRGAKTVVNDNGRIKEYEVHN